MLMHQHRAHLVCIQLPLIPFVLSSFTLPPHFPLTKANPFNKRIRLNNYYNPFKNSSSSSFNNQRTNSNIAI